MPNIKSKIKRMQTSAKEKNDNSVKKTRVRNEIKAFGIAVEEKNKELAYKKLQSCISLLNRAESDGVYHKNTVARKISSLTKTYNAMK